MNSPRSSESISPNPASLNSQDSALKSLRAAMLQVGGHEMILRKTFCSQLHYERLKSSLNSFQTTKACSPLLSSPPSPLLLIKMFTLVTLLKCFSVVKKRRDKNCSSSIWKNLSFEKTGGRLCWGKGEKFMNIFALQLFLCSVVLCNALL
jgi:hypothetical protein